MQKKIYEFLNLSERNYYIWKKTKHPLIISLFFKVFENENQLVDYVKNGTLPFFKDVKPVFDKKKYKKLLLQILNLSERNYYIWQNHPSKNKAINFVQQIISNEVEAEYFILHNNILNKKEISAFNHILNFISDPLGFSYHLSPEQFKINNVIKSNLNKNIFDLQNISNQSYQIISLKYCIFYSLFQISQVTHLCSNNLNLNNLNIIFAQHIISNCTKDTKLMSILTTVELSEIYSKILYRSIQITEFEIELFISLIANNNLMSLFDHIITVKDSNRQAQYFDSFLFFLICTKNLEPFDFYNKYCTIVYKYQKKYNLNIEKERIIFYHRIAEEIINKF